ncbi:hypothetical protein FGG08_007256 [Glutinoglossum americanum]|uniref:DNA repair protein RAD14 n=1 Tax=Glutinoglossum americanum TaxID=1670608 RepID=A0A9P8L150_9PEZI|nr:hypothetical protein FGG08_007256 [Glutinoglossum americanum]
MNTDGPSTPPHDTHFANSGVPRRPPLTPEQIRKIETNRLKAKAIRDQREADARNAGEHRTLDRTASGFTAGQKRTYSSISTANTPATLRDGRRNNGVDFGGSARPRDGIRPAQKFTKYVEYDFSKMTDTKGGFLTAEDDPHNKALHASKPGEEKPAHMTLKEWERHQLMRSLRDQKAGPFEPGLSVLKDQKAQKVCYECGSLEIDWKWEDVFGCRVCNTCKEKRPEKYSLLTKTEAREDYLLTDPELKDEELLPHLERPNPHKATWNNMMLYLRYQVEEYAFSSKKWGSPEALDAQFAKRESEKKKRKEDKFRTKLHELKKRTRVEAYRRNRAVGGGGGDFGDDLGQRGKHVHRWGRAIDDPETGMGVKTCVDCGMEVEELEF